MEARLQQLHPSFRGFNPYSTAATAMHMKHYQVSAQVTLVASVFKFREF